MSWPPLPIGSPWDIILTIAFWPTWIYLCGFSAHLLPLSVVGHESWLTRIRPWERNGNWYAKRLRITKWKDRVPEAGAAFAGGFAKRSTEGGDADTVRRFIVETRRAEYAHWSMGAGWIIPALWSPWYAGVIDLIFGLIFALPFVAIQRYNRARLLRLLGRIEG